MRYACEAIGVVCLLCAAGAARAADAPPQRSQQQPARQSVWFDGGELVLAWEGENPGEVVREFIPAGQNLDSWTKLASIRAISSSDDPKLLAGALVPRLKEQNPLSPSAIIENPGTGAVIVDFVVWPADASFVEFNVFKYEKRAGGGVEAQQYALRSYDKQEEFLKGLPPVPSVSSI
jgi:hypothetical protein